MRIGIENYYLNKFSKKGPYIFLSRLINAIKKNNLCKLTSYLDPRADCNLFLISKKKNYFYNKDYFLRVDGLYLDKFNTKYDSQKLNNEIFNSIEKAKGLIFISDYSRIITEKLYKRTFKPYVIIHNAIDIKEFSNEGNNLRKKFNFNDQDRIIVTSAQWRRHKRLKETIEFLNLLNNDSLTNKFRYKLLVLGENKDELFEKNKDITFTGYIKSHKLPEYYRSGDIYLHLAWIEPCGNTQIEAMSCGLPVVCCNNGGIKETIINANGGKVIDTDEIYNFEMVDYYNPPKPNFIKLKEGVLEIFNNLEFYKKNIKRENLDINIAAKKYVEFIKKNETN